MEEAEATAVLIDADQIPYRVVEPVLAALQPDRRVLSVHVYRNYASRPFASWNGAVTRLGLVPVHTPQVAHGKNAADMRLTIDAMDMLHTSQVQTFVIVSNDGDFAPLALRLTSAGRHVVGVGSRSASEAFRAACTEFWLLEALGLNF